MMMTKPLLRSKFSYDIHTYPLERKSMDVEEATLKRTRDSDADTVSVRNPPSVDYIHMTLTTQE